MFFTFLPIRVRITQLTTIDYVYSNLTEFRAAEKLYDLFHIFIKSQKLIHVLTVFFRVRNTWLLSLNNHILLADVMLFACCARLFYKQQFYNQHQTEIGKKSSKC